MFFLSMQRANTFEHIDGIEDIEGVARLWMTPALGIFTTFFNGHRRIAILVIRSNTVIATGIIWEMAHAVEIVFEIFSD